MKPNGKLTFKTKSVMGMGEIPNVMAYSVMSILFLFFLTDIVGILPAFAGIVFMIGRVWDAFTDPTIGMISDRTRTRWGRRRPFFIIAAVPLGLFFFLMFNIFPVESQFSKTAVYTVVHILFITSVTLYAIPYLSLLAELTDDYAERTSIMNYRMFFTFVFGLSAAVLPKMFADSFVPDELRRAVKQGFETSDAFIPYLQEGYMMAALIVGLVIMVFPFIVFFTIKERYQERAPREKLQLFKQFANMFRNKSFRTLIFIYVGSYAGINVIEGFVIYYMKYWIGREDQMPILFVSVVISSVVTLPLWSIMSRKYGKKKTAIFGLLFWGVTQMLWIFITPTMPDFIIYAVGALVGIGYGSAHTMPWAMFPDVLDQDEIMTGERREGVYSGVMTFLMKISNSIAVFSIGMTLQLTGYVANAVQTPKALQGIRFTMALAPLAFVLIGLAGAFLFPITKERYSEIRRELENRNAVNA
ncbi:glycoside-pentoside-hexuronide (GPH):cation symporter [bacterium]|nr:glycoside-pentoside-hexuronide (GPH):cation symporter [bacterium]